MKNISNSCDIQQQQPCAHAHRFTNRHGLEFISSNSINDPSYYVSYVFNKGSIPFLDTMICIRLYIPKNIENSQDSLMNSSFTDLWNRKGKYWVLKGILKFEGDDRTGKHVISCMGSAIESSAMSIYEMIAYTEKEFDQQFALQNVDLVTTQGIRFKSIRSISDRIIIEVSLTTGNNILMSRITIEQFVKLRNTALNSYGIDLFWELFFMTGYLQINQFHFTNYWSIENRLMIDREYDEITIYSDDAHNSISLCYFEHFNSLEDLMAFSDDDFIEEYGEYDSIAA